MHKLKGSLENVRAFYHRHKTVLALGLFYTVTRLLASLFTQMTFAPYGPGFSDFLDQARLSAGGAQPFIDYWMEYPPAFPWLTVAAYRLSLFVPAWTEPNIWFGTFLRWSMVPFETGALLLVYAIGQQIYDTSKRAWHSTLWYALSFVTMYVPLGWFDVLPLFWLLLALYFLLRDRPGWTGVSIGLGLLAKPISVMALPAAWQRLSDIRSRVKLIVTTLASFALPMLPFFMTSPQITLAHFRNLLSRSSWETIWAFIDGYFGYGVVAPLDQRFDPNTALWQAHPGAGRYDPWITLAFAVLGLYLWTRRIDWRSPRRTVAFTGLTWCIFSLWSKGYSPQWAINFVPFVALLMPNLRGATILGLLGLALVAEWPVAFTLAGTQEWFLIAVVIWRTLLFVLLTFELGSIALSKEPGRRWRIGYRVAAFLLLISAVIIGWNAVDGYAASRSTDNPLQPVVQRLQEESTSDSGLICRDIAVCEQIAPFTSGLDTHWLPSPSNWQANFLPEFAQEHPLLWLVEMEQDAGHDLTVERYLSKRYGKVSQEWLGAARVSRFVALDLPPTRTVDATFGCCLRLNSYAVHAEGTFIHVELNWESTSPMETSYKVFVHALNADGELIAQNDQYPVGGFKPTDQWMVSIPVQDRHGLLLPAPYQPDTILRAGLYDPVTGERLPVSESGMTFVELFLE